MILNKRKICFIITSFIHYSRNFLILDELKKRDDVDLHIVIGGAALLPKYSSKFANVKEILGQSSFGNIHEIYFYLEGDKGVTKAKTAGMGTIEFASIFEKIKPDVVVVRGDRFEVLSAATAAAYMDIPIAHIEGGDVTGSIDENIRHAITKLSQIHFVTNEDSYKRIIKMGEHKDYVFNFGSPDVEAVREAIGQSAQDIDLNQIGSGFSFDLNKDFVMVMFHPVTSELENLPENTRILLRAIQELDMPALWFWPNFDAGAEEISRELRVFNDLVNNHKIRFMRYLPPQTFLRLLRRAKCLIGNSSAGIKECSYLGVPVVDVGSRQCRRLQAINVLNVGHDKEAIKEAIKKQVAMGRYPSSDLYFIENTSKKIVEVLATIKLYTQKLFID